MKFFKVHAANVDNLLVASGFQFPDGYAVLVAQGGFTEPDMIRLTTAAKLQEVLTAFEAIGYKVEWVES